ncbi:type VII secretion protein EssB [Neobacillus soli]|uniref:type VII secretion protein EssB n=1 Tax=Neobacillus soli TaxID=220688 RepID=UPI00082669EA|nr:type VII secretion protein EssB [Neobacillus soli]
MNEKTIKMESMTFHFSIHDDKWQVKLAKSQTRVKNIRQLVLMTENTDFFVPAVVADEDDQFTFSFTVDQKAKKWEDVRKLGRNDKLRLLCNLARFRKLLNARMTFFLHPDNLVFDDNLLSTLVYRGIRDLVPPYETKEENFTLQYKCLIVALFSKKYSFDELYSGSLKNATGTEFERQVGGAEDLAALIKLLENSYQKEQLETEKKMQIVPKKRFRLFKQLTFSMVVLLIILAVPLIYFSFIKLPFQDHLLEAHRHFLSADYGKVISDLEIENPEKLSDAGKYILAYSYIKTEPLENTPKEAIMKNISLKSDSNYSLYWIYNGRGDFDKSVDLAKYIDDPVLIMYGFVKKIEKAKNDPELSGTEREKEIQDYQEQLKTYTDKYGLDPVLKTE